MKTRFLKTRLVSVILTISALIGCLALSSCQNKAQETEKYKVDHVYKATGFDFGSDIKADALLTSADSIVICGSEVTDDENDIADNIIIKIDRSTLEFTKTTVDTADGSYLIQAALEPDGSILFLKGFTDEKTGETLFFLDRMTDGKTERICGDLGALIESDGQDSMFGKNKLWLDFLSVDKDGNIYICSSYAIAVLDKNLNKLFEIEVTGFIDALESTSDGRVYASFRNNSTDNQIRYIDIEKKDFGAVCQLPDANRFFNPYYFVGPGYDIYVKDDTAIWGCDLSGSEPVELLNFLNSDFEQNIVRDVAIIDADTILLNCRDYDIQPEKWEIYLMTRVPDDEIPEKYIVRLAYRYSGYYELAKNVIRFNRSNDKFRIELIDYHKYESNNPDDWDNSEILEKDLLADSAPDIVLLTDFSKSDNWLAQGAFTDLNKLIEADDSFDRSDYFGSVLDMCTDAKGRMCRFITNFSIATVCADPEYVAFDHWNLDEFIDFASSLPEDTYLFNIITHLTLLQFSLNASLGDFVDWKNADCDFDNTTFRRLLEFIKSSPAKFNYKKSLSGDDLADYNENNLKPYQDGTILLYETGSNNLQSYIKSSVCFGKESGVRFIGYPASEGSGTLIRPQMSFGINEKSRVKEAAWEFIKSAAGFVSDGSEDWFPVNIEKFEKSCGSEIGYYWYFAGSNTYRLGKLSQEKAEEKLNEMIQKKLINEGGVLIASEEKHIDALKAMINGAKEYPDAEFHISEIIWEESQMYFSGEKSLDETVKIIQDRVSTYISEKS